MALKKKPATETTDEAPAAEGSVSALPDGYDSPAQSGDGAVSAVPDLPQTGKLDS